MQPVPGAEAAEQAGEGLGVLTKMRLGFSRQYYAVASALGLRRMQDYFQGASPLLASAGPVWILGEKYENPPDSDAQELGEQVMAGILLDFSSRPWMTYRTGFPPIGPAELTSDTGWGCTLRSGQMLLAQVLLTHISGRQWRRPADLPGRHSELAQLLRWFWDSPGPEHPFSLHSLVAAGRKHGVVPGEWLGPWTLCHALQQAVSAHEPAGLHVHLVNTPGGGAPVLYTASVEAIFAEHEGSDGDGATAAAGKPRGLLLLVPLVLGIGKVNPRYVPQLRAVLRWPQSGGIVGGRPGSSLYFLGFQDAHVLYLDPHHPQPAGSSPEDAAPSHFCDSPRTMPIAAIDPSLAIAFYCRSPDSFRDLAERLSELEAGAEGAPLLNLVQGAPPPPFGERSSSLEVSGVKGEEQWELL